MVRIIRSLTPSPLSLPNDPELALAVPSGGRIRPRSIGLERRGQREHPLGHVLGRVACYIFLTVGRLNSASAHIQLVKPQVPSVIASYFVGRARWAIHMAYEHMSVQVARRRDLNSAYPNGFLTSFVPQRTEAAAALRFHFYLPLIITALDPSGIAVSIWLGWFLASDVVTDVGRVIPEATVEPAYSLLGNDQSVMDASPRSVGKCGHLVPGLTAEQLYPSLA